MGACNWALMQDASASALFLPLTCPRHVRTPGWNGGQRIQIRVQCGDAGRLEPMLGGPSCSGG
eukprot:9840708-Alexandrium_andersonii.AAC.1